MQQRDRHDRIPAPAEREPEVGLLFVLTTASLLALVFFCTALVDWSSASFGFGSRAWRHGFTAWYWPAAGAFVLTVLLAATGKVIARQPKRRSLRVTAVEEPAHRLDLDADGREINPHDPKCGSTDRLPPLAGPSRYLRSRDGRQPPQR